MEIISTTTSSSPLPVLPRLDRVDRLLRFLEEKINIDTNWESVENKSVSMSSAMEEVHQRGTLMDRLAALENRVLQLWAALEVEDHDHRHRHQHHHDHVDQMNQDERNAMTWGSSSASTSTLEADHHRHQLPIEGKQKHRRWKNIYHFRKWLSWFPLGC